MNPPKLVCATLGMARSTGYVHPEGWPTSRCSSCDSVVLCTPRSSEAISSGQACPVCVPCHLKESPFSVLFLRPDPEAEEEMTRAQKAGRN